MNDKALHFITCLAITILVALPVAIVAGNALYGAFTGFATAMAAGMGKEFGDMLSPMNKWDWNDFLVDFIGGLAGVAIVLSSYFWHYV